MNTSLIYLEHASFMRGLDTAHHLWGLYSCQICIHKWWHHILYFLGDLTLLNIWVLHCAEHVAACVPLLSHIEFQLGKARLLGSMWTRSNKVSLVGLQQIPKSIHWLGYGSSVKLKYARNNAKLYANNAGVYGYLWAIVGPLPFTSQRMKMRGQTFVVGSWEFFC